MKKLLLAGLLFAASWGALAQGGWPSWTTRGATYNPASIVETGGTIDGVTIGGTTPAAGTFTVITETDGTRTFKVLVRTADAGGLRAGYDVAVNSAHVLNLAGDLAGGGTAGGVGVVFFSAGAGTWYEALKVRNVVGAATTGTLNLMPDGGTVVMGGAVTTTGLTTVTGGIKGTTTNDSATAGNVGEYQEVNCGIPAASGASVAFTNASPTVGTWTAHPFQKTGVAFGSYACPFTITATAPTGLSTATNYWATPIDANTFHVSTSAALAAAGTWANTTGSTSTSNLTNSIALTTTAGLSPALVLLTAGDWDCSGQAIRVLGATTSVTNMQTGINSASTTVGGFGTYFDFETAANIMTATSNPIHSTPTVRLSLASTTAEYLVALDTFTASTNTVSGFIRCRRMR